METKQRKAVFFWKTLQNQVRLAKISLLKTKTEKKKGLLKKMETGSELKVGRCTTCYGRKSTYTKKKQQKQDQKIFLLN